MSPPSLRDRIRRVSPAAAFSRERLRRIDPEPLAAGAVAGVAGICVFLVAVTVFAYHSNNHDEAVYLFQAAMLLEGRLELHLDDLAGAFRPWFFVEDDGRLYSKYSPVTPAVYAASMALFGEPRVILSAVAAGNAALAYRLGSMAFDRRVGLVASILFAASPLALVTTATFLPYAPATFLNLLFAVAYLRGVRDRSIVAAGVAGVAIGVAFFARPYTAVLFATPFVLHALYAVGSSIRRRGPGTRLPEPVSRHGVTALFGLLFVGVTLAYNLRMTGAPFSFPFEAFAPLDGPGFGRRQILGHSVRYTPELALEANGYVLWYFATRWFTAGPVGTALATGGLALAGHRWFRGRRALDADPAEHAPFERTAGLLLAASFASVIAGNVLFWGNYNVLATPSDPTDGLVSLFGPFYHFDLLAPLSVFAALAIVVGLRRIPPALRARLEPRLSPQSARVLVFGLLVAGVLVGGVAQVAAVADPLERNAAHADRYEAAYEPIERTSFDDALVFVPTPYGNWQHHPFQFLRNDPGLDGPVVYALDRNPGGDFAVLDAYPDRTHYRYAYRGEWTPDPNRHVVPKLERLEVQSGETIAGETVVGVPDRVERATVRLETRDGDHADYVLEDPGESISVRWSLDRDTGRLEAPGAESPVELGEADLLALTVTLAQPDGGTLTYRQETTVRTTAEGVEVVWPPQRSVCSLVTDCGNAGTYLPDDPDAHRDGVRFETRIDPEE